MQYKKEDEGSCYARWYARLTDLGYVGQFSGYANRLFPDRIGIMYHQERITFQQLYRQIVAVHFFLVRNGICPGDVVVICFENSPHFYRFYHGIWHAGAIVAPLNTFLSAAEVKQIVSDAQPKCIITSSMYIHLFDGLEIPLVQADDVPLTIDDQDMAPVDRSLDATCALLYTSGTTGVPKGVMLSSTNILANCAQMLARLNFNDESCPERVLGILPLFHVFAQATSVWAPFLIGASVILVEKIDRTFIIEGLKKDPTVVLGVPSLYGLFCLMKNLSFNTVRYFISGADVMPDTIRMAFALLYGRKILIGYGLTEASPVVAFVADDQLHTAPYIGKPLAGIQVRVLDEQDQLLGINQIGQLVINGPNVMQGYYKAEEQTAQVLKDGWLYTGDLVVQHADQSLSVIGRIKDTIKQKGINIYPQEIEHVLMAHDAVMRVGVIGKSYKNSGEVPIAYIQTKMVINDPDTLFSTFCLGHLAPYKVPKKFICTTYPLPLTATGKVDKKVLRKNSDDVEIE